MSIFINKKSNISNIGFFILNQQNIDEINNEYIKIISDKYNINLNELEKLREITMDTQKRYKQTSEIHQVDTVHNILLDIIQKQKEKENNNNIWKNSFYKDLHKLQSNNVGIVGEELIHNICKICKIDANCDGSKTKQIGGGKGDGVIMNNFVEIKTSLQGTNYPSFQHELGEVPWKGFKYMIFVDISPNCVYITIFENFSENIYKEKINYIPYFLQKELLRERT